MKLGLHYWNYSTPADPPGSRPTLAETARIAEQAGISSFTVMDHYFQMEGTTSAEEPMLEGYTTLGYLAAQTDRMTLGLLVTGVMYRYPGLLAKIVTTLDVLSGGRARLGIGASWYEREQRGLGVPVVPVARAVRAARGDAADLPADVERRQRPVRGPALPAGRDAVRAGADQPAAPADHDRRWRREEDAAAGGPVRRRVQPVRHSPAEVAHKLDVLREHCDAEGRDYDSIEKTVLVIRPALVDVDAFVAEVAEYAALGVTEVQTMPDRHPVEYAHQLAEQVVPRLAELG